MSYASSSPSETMALPESSTWPNVIGIVAIVFACLGMLGGCLGLVSVVAIDFMRDLMADMPGGTAQFDHIADNKVLHGGIAVGGLLIAALLLTAGIMIMRRRPSAWSLVMGWIVLKTIYLATKVPVDYTTAMKQFEVAEDQAASGEPTAAVGEFGPVLAAVSAGLTFVWGIALPLFLLIWFLRPRIRREVKSW